jgi:hypothetical protein
MASVYAEPKQINANAAYYVNVASLQRKVLQNVGASDDLPQLSTAIWSNQGYASSLITLPGGVLRDMGKNLVSSGRIFRKVQLLTSNTPTTAGVAGTGTGAVTDYYQGYIELPGLQGASTGGDPAPVAKLG